ncbi:hypothetical protein LP52_06625 [Streptomonospora alba]|uniref:SHSP domain-containing protein n=1 Tax=Streptomonospora alba TaxID=183763 RepID=A0A0C2JRU9_9ACTN|nr:Hsp20/alpha crystallin family protein [Streptomonospora alba]KIH99552.1 hypothetical protein LP52_06625 [Streptomonospora alba]
MATQRKSTSNPFSGLVDFVSDLNRMSDEMHSRGHDQTEARSHVNAWTPLLDIAASGDQLIIHADLAGVDAEDVEVTYTAPTLSIAGERRLRDGAPHQGDYHTKELSWGRFRRNVTLPEGVREGDIAVTLSQGLLRVTVERYTRAEGPAHLPVADSPSQR